MPGSLVSCSFTACLVPPGCHLGGGREGAEMPDKLGEGSPCRGAMGMWENKQGV